MLLLRRYAVDQQSSEVLLAWLKPFEDFVYRQVGDGDFTDHVNLSKRLISKSNFAHGDALIDKMVLLIKEELHHFQQVLEIMQSRDIAYDNHKASRYAKGLMKHVRTHEPAKLTDTLICGAYIEARSCERFAKLAPHLDSSLSAFYVSLLRSEAPSRKLPATDPFDRQITIGLGAFVELLRLAAANKQELLSVEWFPEGSDESRLGTHPIAKLSLKARAASPNSLFAAAPLRRTTRGHYDSKPISQLLINDVVKRAGICVGLRWATTIDREQVLKLNDLAVRAYEREIDTDAAYLESAELMRIGKQEVATNPDGISLTGPFFEWLNLFGLISHAGLRDLKGRARQSGREIAKELATAQGHVWLLSTGNSRTEQIATGAHYLRLNLAATEVGLAMQPLSQALQEYPEMAAEYVEANNRLGARDGETVQMWARVGYSGLTPPSPRWALSTRLIKE